MEVSYNIAAWFIQRDYRGVDPRKNLPPINGTHGQYSARRGALASFPLPLATVVSVLYFPGTQKASDSFPHLFF